jgi:hypothetical protein
MAYWTRRLSLVQSLRAIWYVALGLYDMSLALGPCNERL